MIDFRQLTKEEVKDSRNWARENYEPFSEISELWHPVVRDECRKINAEQGTLFIGGVADGEFRYIPHNQIHVSAVAGEGHHNYSKNYIELSTYMGKTYIMEYFLYSEMNQMEAMKRLFTYYTPFNYKTS